MIEAPNQLLTVFLGLVLLSVWLDSRYGWARKISPVVMILFLAGLVSNLGLITRRSTFYDQVAGFTVPFAVCLILFTVNLEDLRRTGKQMLAAFAVACTGTVIGALTAGLLLQSQLARILGHEAWKLAGPFTGSEERRIGPPALRVLDLTALGFAAVVIIVLSELIKARLIVDVMPSLPTILIVTTLALVLAQLPFIKRLRGAFYLFFCAVGAMIDVEMAIVLSPVLFIYVMIMIAVHFVSVYGIGRLLHLDIRVLTIASAAAKTGPPTVVALANVQDWKTLLLPGVAMGLLGYAVGNYLGFAAAYMMKALLGQ